MSGRQGPQEFACLEEGVGSPRPHWLLELRWERVGAVEGENGKNHGVRGDGAKGR